MTWVDVISATEGTAHAGSRTTTARSPASRSRQLENEPRGIGSQDLWRDHESIEAFIPRRLRQRPTPQTLVEAVWYCVRERGLAALREPANLTRLQTFDPAARAQLNER